jgi:excisionase family DNA binding protein
MQPAATNATERPQGAGPFLRMAEAAERLGVHKSTIWRLVQTGRLPALQLRGKGSTVRIDEAEFERWLYGEDEAE